MPGFWTRSRAVVQSAFRLPGGLPTSTGFSSTVYSLDSSSVDHKLALALYTNTEPRYKLGAGFARPAINIPVGFMGTPILKAETGGDAQRELDRQSKTWSGDILRVHQAVFLDGEALLRVRPANRSPAYVALFEGEKEFFEVGYNQAGTYEIFSMDEDLGAVNEIRITHSVMVKENGTMIEKKLYEILTADKIRHEWEGKFRPDKEFDNPLGFVPAVLLKNESANHELHGRSELEPLEPYLRFYNDVMLHAGSASKLHSTAKLILRVKDVERFITNNFTDAEIADKRLRFKDKDVLFFDSGMPDLGSGGTIPQEGADIIQADAPLGDTNMLLEYIFLNIVDVSEVPEWAFGGAIASSKASVSEQSAPLVHKVARKRTSVENAWGMIGRMALRMADVKSAVEATWDDLQQRDTKSENDAIKALVEAMISLVDANIVSRKSAVDTLRPFMPAVLEYIVEQGDDQVNTEKERIDRELEERDTGDQDLLDRILSGGAQDEQDRQAGLAAVG